MNVWDAWDARDRQSAHDQGWGIFDADYGVVIQKDDEMDRFKTDAEAEAFVSERAEAGDERCEKALRVVGKGRVVETEKRRDCFLQDQDGNDYLVVYSVTMSFVVSATGPCDIPTLVDLVNERIRAAGGVEAEDINETEIIAVEGA
jgi:hypothetical protein